MEMMVEDRRIVVKCKVKVKSSFQETFLYTTACQVRATSIVLTVIEMLQALAGTDRPRMSTALPKYRQCFLY